MKVDSIESCLGAELRRSVDQMLEERYESHPYWNAVLSLRGGIELRVIGPWLWVRARFFYEGTISDMSGDRDQYFSDGSWDWVGSTGEAPPEPALVEDLDRWAILRARNQRDGNDTENRGEHQGAWVDAVSADGTVKLRRGGHGYTREHESEYAVSLVPHSRPER